MRHVPFLFFSFFFLSPIKNAEYAYEVFFLHDDLSFFSFPFLSLITNTEYAYEVFFLYYDLSFFSSLSLWKERFLTSINSDGKIWFFQIKLFNKMSTVKQNLPTTQSALQWVRVSKKNTFERTTTTPLINPLDLVDDQILIGNHAVSLNPIDYIIPGRTIRHGYGRSRVKQGKEKVIRVRLLFTSPTPYSVGWFRFSVHVLKWYIIHTD